MNTHIFIYIHKYKYTHVYAHNPCNKTYIPVYTIADGRGKNGGREARGVQS